jgi:hypothetical protein
MRLGLAILMVMFANAAEAQACRVVDPELQGSYSGPCVNGLADGYGIASGAAEYRGEFKAGLKHGKGEKRWPSGDRYEGGFLEDRKHGLGTYTWGRGPWMGERYEGEYLHDLRDGYGVYRWATGDVYAGPWEKDLITGPATPMMAARAKFEEEARAAVAKIGQKVCRQVPVGIAARDWLRGSVAQVSGDRVGVRIEDPGHSLHVIGGAEARRGAVIWDVPQAWTPCF